MLVKEGTGGVGQTTRIWAIEMNKGRDLYLKIYGDVDKVDQMLKDWGLRCVMWR